MQVSDSKIKALENRLLRLENKDLLKSVLRKARNVVEAEERARGVENLRKYREKRNRSEATRKYRDRVRAQVLEFAKLMTNPSNKDIRKHVPAELQKTVVDFLGTINLASKTALRTDGMQATKADEQYLKAMKKLRAAIKKNVDTHGLYSGYADLPEDFMETFDAMIEKAESLMEQNSGEFVINRMSAEDLKELSSRSLRVEVSFSSTAMPEFCATVKSPARAPTLSWAKGLVSVSSFTKASVTLNLSFVKKASKLSSFIMLLRKSAVRVSSLESELKREVYFPGL